MNCSHFDLWCCSQFCIVARIICTKRPPPLLLRRMAILGRPVGHRLMVDRTDWHPDQAGNGTPVRHPFARGCRKIPIVQNMSSSFSVHKLIVNWMVSVGNAHTKHRLIRETVSVYQVSLDRVVNFRCVECHWWNNHWVVMTRNKSQILRKILSLKNKIRRVKEIALELSKNLIVAGTYNCSMCVQSQLQRMTIDRRQHRKNEY